MKRKRRRNRQPDDDGDENNSYVILVSERERVMEVTREWTSLLYIYTT